ncbi:hypothetical protein [Pelagovum pacificum]|uniref:Uncharacterized protein n=1 Tax=Pelagovum pacificum TaxID=2588711 RepID=A0A5C5GEL8_9RHOB|nr:hypothetical protein [Pelagovum pacificum]QQA43670.1 hypothetical protein I8N54_03585 [Pelagovum pacificum]TNY33195.1 hypothetical protein FHY64_07945 [Pelagovum pacificum]
MTRLILGLLLLAALIMAAQAIMDFARPGRRTRRAMPESAARPGSAGTEIDDPMPRTLKLVAYVLLLALMAGVSAGWLGAV